MPLQTAIEIVDRGIRAQIAAGKMLRVMAVRARPRRRPGRARADWPRRRRRPRGPVVRHRDPWRAAHRDRLGEARGVRGRWPTGSADTARGRTRPRGAARASTTCRSPRSVDASSSASPTRGCSPACCATSCSALRRPGRERRAPDAADDAAVDGALDTASADDVLDALPDGLDGPSRSAAGPTPAASASGSRWPGPCSPRRRSSCWSSRPAPSTPTPRPGSPSGWPGTAAAAPRSSTTASPLLLGQRRRRRPARGRPGHRRGHAPRAPGTTRHTATSSCAERRTTDEHRPRPAHPADRRLPRRRRGRPATLCATHRRLLTPGAGAARPRGARRAGRAVARRPARRRGQRPAHVRRRRRPDRGRPRRRRGRPDGADLGCAGGCRSSSARRCSPSCASSSSGARSTCRCPPSSGPAPATSSPAPPTTSRRCRTSCGSASPRCSSPSMTVLMTVVAALFTSPLATAADPARLAVLLVLDPSLPASTPPTATSGNARPTPRLNGVVAETVDGARTIDALSLAGVRRSRFHEALRECYEAERYTLGPAAALVPVRRVRLLRADRRGDRLGRLAGHQRPHHGGRRDRGDALHPADGRPARRGAQLARRDPGRRDVAGPGHRRRRRCRPTARPPASEPDGADIDGRRRPLRLPSRPRRAARRRPSTCDRASGWPSWGRPVPASPRSAG